MNRLKRKIRNDFSHQEVAVNLHCQELEVNNWLISEFIIRKLAPIVGIHPYPINEQSLMIAAVCGLKPAFIFEWGTNLGKSARVFYEAAREFNIPTQIFSIDLPDDVQHVEHPGKRRGMYVKNLENVKLLQGDGLETSLKIYREKKPHRDFSSATSLGNPLFFLDGDHDYSSVKRELEGIMDSAPEANILLHDTFFQSPESHYNIGPYRAIQDVLPVAHSYRMLCQNLGLPGMTLLYRKDQAEK